MDLPRRSGVVCGENLLRTSHFDTAEPPEALAGAARLPQQPRRPWLDVSVPLRPGRPPAGTERTCCSSVRVPDDRVLMRRGRSGQASEVGPRSVYSSRRIDRDAGVVADEATGEFDVRIGGLRRRASLAGIAVRRAAECVI